MALDKEKQIKLEKLDKEIREYSQELGERESELRGIKIRHRVETKLAKTLEDECEVIRETLKELETERKELGAGPPTGEAFIDGEMTGPPPGSDTTIGDDVTIGQKIVSQEYTMGADSEEEDKMAEQKKKEGGKKK